MGGGSSKSSANTTNVTTNTSTTIRDIGLTGQNAVDMAAVIESGALARTQATANTLNQIVQQTGQGWQQLVGGAGDYATTLVITAEEAAGSLVAKAGEYLRGATETQQKASEEAAALQSEALPLLLSEQQRREQGELLQAVPWLSVAAIGVFAILYGMRN